MFENIGKKIKSLAVVIFILEAVGSFFGGIALLVDGGRNETLGVLLLFGGVFVSWISSWFLYGFGEIIDKLQDIERNTRPMEKKLYSSVPQSQNVTHQPPADTTFSAIPISNDNATPLSVAAETTSPCGTIECSHCHAENQTNRTTCWQCGSYISKAEKATVEVTPPRKENSQASTKCKCGNLFWGDVCPSCGREKGSVI